MRSANPSAIAFSLCWMAASERVWVFCSRATSRNVTIVVSVLMISCQVLTSRMKTNEGTQTTTSSRQKAKNQAPDTNRSATVANRSNSDSLLLTPVGISALPTGVVAPAWGCTVPGETMPGLFPEPGSAKRSDDADPSRRRGTRGERDGTAVRARPDRVRPRQRERAAQSAQPLRRDGVAAVRARYRARRPADRRRGAARRPYRGATVRHRPARGAGDRDDRLGGAAVAGRSGPRPFRRQYRCGRRARRRGNPARRSTGCGVPWRPARSGGRRAGPGTPADAADRRWARPGRPGPQPGGPGPAARRGRAVRRP